MRQALEWVLKQLQNHGSLAMAAFIGLPLLLILASARPDEPLSVDLTITPNIIGPWDFTTVGIAAVNPGGALPAFEYIHELWLPCGSDFAEVSEWSTGERYSRAAVFVGPVDRTLAYGRTWWGAPQSYLLCHYMFKLENGKGMFPITPGESLGASFRLQATGARAGTYYVYDAYTYVSAGKQLREFRKNSVVLG